MRLPVKVKFLHTHAQVREAVSVLSSAARQAARSRSEGALKKVELWGDHYALQLGVCEAVVLHQAVGGLADKAPAPRAAYSVVLHLQTSCTISASGTSRSEVCDGSSAGCRRMLIPVSTCRRPSSSCNISASGFSPQAVNRAVHVQHERIAARWLLGLCDCSQGARAALAHQKAGRLPAGVSGQVIKGQLVERRQPRAELHEHERCACTSCWSACAPVSCACCRGAVCAAEQLQNVLGQYDAQSCCSESLCLDPVAPSRSTETTCVRELAGSRAGAGHSRGGRHANCHVGHIGLQHCAESASSGWLGLRGSTTPVLLSSACRAHA